ncbi:putative bifunctional diguanylate cyclase/phosphodiesterase [Roseomonas elaeocarpi]|uniref:Bifunctional diguanylate cyclase/phosphodiesterase n=1 Tax=Roseomonas elaeocarpi TaxID=907779 RepID=A0ABV6JWK6_9PROT
MTAPAIPFDEAQRLAALKACQILDTPREPRFDALARLTARLFGAELGTVSLIDEHRQWFKATTGAERLPDIPREDSLCAHTILQPREVTVVEDLSRDPRFADNHLVTGPLKARFYASAPLLDPSGYAVGTICAVDPHPQRPEPSAVAAMADLAAAASAMLQLHRRMAELRDMADLDPLTGLLNRSGFSRALEARQGSAFSLFCFDLDRFKEVNDLFGHAGGDQLLVEFSRRLRAALRAEDVIARFGGDEFVAMITAQLTDAELGAIATRILADLAAPVSIAGQSVPILASIGIARAPADGSDPLALLHRADVALYRAKTSGRRQFRFYDASLEADDAAEEAFREAARTDAFALEFDPIIRLRDGAVTGYEARAVWLRPGGARLTAEEFAPLAGQQGLLLGIENRELARACAAAAGWPGGQRLVFRVSPTQLRSEGFVTVVATALADAGLPPERLELTVSETMLSQGPPELAERLHRLQALGTGLSIHDFGANQAPLGALFRHSFTSLRLPAALISATDAAPGKSALLQAIIPLSRGLSLELVVLGVETEEQRQSLLALGIDAVQPLTFDAPAELAMPRPTLAAAVKDSLASEDGVNGSLST